MQLAIFMFLTIIIVSTVNLVMNDQKEKEQQRYVKIMKTAYEKVEYSVKSRLLQRLLVDMANGFEWLHSDVIKDIEKE